jgi:hypothetical protein
VSLAKVLDDFKISIAQCENLITNAHKADTAGVPFFLAIGQQQITTSAFLNMFIAWESFLESSIAELMIGVPTINGSFPVKYVAPLDLATARAFVIGMQRFFDYGNHQHIKKLVTMYFQNGYPFEPHISAIYSYLDDLRTMRNASAHISFTTQIAMEALALRLFSNARPGITLYQLLTAVDPRSATDETIFITYKDKLLVAAELIAIG